MWLLSRLRHVGRCDRVRRVVDFSLLVEIVWQVDEVLPFVCLQCLRMERQVLRVWRACINLRLAMVEFCH